MNVRFCVLYEINLTDTAIYVERISRYNSSLNDGRLITIYVWDLRSIKKKKEKRTVLHDTRRNDSSFHKFESYPDVLSAPPLDEIGLILFFCRLRRQNYAGPELISFLQRSIQIG